MSASGKSLLEKKAITPLWIVALFVSLTETVLGVAVTQTQGGIQIALTVFVISFPLLIAGSFFAILWHRPYVFYPPTEFSEQIKVGEYVEAMQRRPELKQTADAGGALAAIIDTTNPIEPAEEIDERKEVDNFIKELMEYFIDNVSISGMLMLYACTIAYSKHKAFNFQELCSKLVIVDKGYIQGFMVAVGSVGIVNYTDTQGVWNVTFVEGSLRERVLTGLDMRIKKIPEEGAKDDSTQQLVERFMADKKAIEEYFN